MRKGFKLTDKQERFCQEYMIDLNATQACMRAGYSKRNPDKVGPALLGNPRVSARISELKQKVQAFTDVTVSEVISTLREVIARSLCKKQVMEFNQASKKLKQKIDPETGEGVWQYDSNGVNKAAELLGKHIGLFEKHQSQIKPEPTRIVIVQNDKTKSDLEKLGDMDE